MNQSRSASLIESIIGVAVAYTTNVAAQTVVLPLFDINVPLRTNIGIGLVMTIIAIPRRYLLRRVFNWKEK